MTNYRQFRRNRKKRNFGLGHQPGFAVKVALAQAYGGDRHFYTRFTHHARFQNCLAWLSKLDPPVRDLRHITQEHAVAYSQHLADAVASGEMEVAYAQNLISTLNTVMRAVRMDREIWLSPSDAVGKRSYIRTILPLASWDKVIEAVRMEEQNENYRGAALILLWRAFGLRFREAALADLHRMHMEAEQYKAVWIQEGTKGGFVSADRSIPIESVQWQALDYALNVISSTGTCLVDTNNSLKEFLNQHASPLRSTLKKVGIECPKDLRAEHLIELYERASGQLAPVKEAGPFDRDADILGREAVGRRGGHKRATVASSYIGKRHRACGDQAGLE